MQETVIRENPRTGESIACKVKVAGRNGHLVALVDRDSTDGAIRAEIHDIIGSGCHVNIRIGRVRIAAWRPICGCGPIVYAACPRVGNLCGCGAGKDDGKPGQYEGRKEGFEVYICDGVIQGFHGFKLLGFTMRRVFYTFQLGGQLFFVKF